MLSTAPVASLHGILSQQHPFQRVGPASFLKPSSNINLLFNGGNSLTVEASYAPAPLNLVEHLRLGADPEVQSLI